MPKVLQLYLELSQYPILASRIREQMRREIFARGIVTKESFENEVRQKAIRSQEREGLADPYVEEPHDVWQERLRKIRDDLTDFYFAYNLPHDLFEEIVHDLLAERSADRDVILSFNPELAPWELLFSQGEAYENAEPEQRGSVQHHLREIIVVLIRAMISDQLSFVRVAREYFTIKDLQEIRAHRFGRGKIGGKAAGMLLAYKVLQRHAKKRSIDVERFLTIPESWFLGSDVFYEFHANNDLFGYMNQKYKRQEQMVEDYPQIYNAYLNSSLPMYIQDNLRDLLEQLGQVPVIVRSSSLLEDNLETSFAGKYDSFFLPNQGTVEENLRELQKAIIRIYASVIRPEALIYRDRKGLIDYDERMGILIQKVEGRRHGRYFFPDLAGVGFSYNPYSWSKRIDREAGLFRMVVGMGTRAVDRVGSDYPRMVALSHPNLRPETGSRMVRQYSQHRIDVIDLEENAFKTLPISEVLDIDFPALGAVASIDQDGDVRPIRGRAIRLEPSKLIITFDNLLADGQFTTLVRDMLATLEEAYRRPVDIEVAGEIVATYPRPLVKVSLLQCRALASRVDGQLVSIPEHIPEDTILFTANQQVPRGYVDDIRYIVYVDPRAYNQIPEPHTRIELGQVVSRLNTALGDENFILMGPGRWGTSNIQLGVRVTYADIYNTRVLIEIAYADEGTVPEVSYGTHFFQDLVEGDIYPLPVYPDDESVIYNEAFLDSAPNMLSKIIPADERYCPYVKVIDVSAITGGKTLTMIMHSEENRAIAFFEPLPEEPDEEE